MKFVDFNDERIPIGKRKVAYVKYAMAHGTSEKAARMQANRKFGFERKGKYLVFVGNTTDLRLPSLQGLTWDEISCIDSKRAESVIIVTDQGGAFDIVGRLSPNPVLCNLPEKCGIEGLKAYAEANGYKFSIQWITP